jgi:hypothetical protein
MDEEMNATDERFSEIAGTLKGQWQSKLFEFCLVHNLTKNSYWMTGKRECKFPSRECFGRIVVRFLTNKDQLKVWIRIKKDYTAEHALAVLREKLGADIEYNVPGYTHAIQPFISNAEQCENLIQWLNDDIDDGSDASKESMSSLDGAIHSYLGEKIKELYELIEDKRLKDLLHQVDKNKSDHPETTLNLARKSAELISKKLYGDLLEKEAGERPLDNLIMEMEKHRCIPRLLSAHLFTIAKYGNFGSHDQGDESQDISTELVAPCLLAYIWTLDWCLKAGYA